MPATMCRSRRAAISDPGPDGRAVRYGLGELERLVAALEHVARVAQLRQHDQARAVACRLLDHAERLAEVRLLLADHRLHLDAGDLDDGFLALAHPPILPQLQREPDVDPF